MGMPVDRGKRMALELGKFQIVGVMNTVIDAGLFAFLVYLGVVPIGAQLISYGAGMVNSYCWNTRWTFSYPKLRNKRAWLRFVLWNICMLSLSAAGLALLKAFGPLTVYENKALITLVTLLVNYWGSRSFVFTRDGMMRKDGREVRPARGGWK